MRPLGSFEDHWTTDLECKKPCFTRDSKSDSLHLLGNHPSSRVGSASTSFPFVDFLGAMRNVTGHFTCIQWLSYPRIKNEQSSREEFRSGSSRRRVQEADLNSKRGNGGRWGKTQFTILLNNSSGGKTVNTQKVKS